MENCPWNDSESAEEAGEQSRLLREFYEGEKPKVRFGVNFRDMPEAFAKHPERVYRVLEFITTLPQVKMRKRWAKGVNRCIIFKILRNFIFKGN